MEYVFVTCMVVRLWNNRIESIGYIVINRFLGVQYKAAIYGVSSVVIGGHIPLPIEHVPHRQNLKMATGSGKTWVMAMAVVWSHFHKKLVPGSDLSTNFLIVAPNIIVYL
jgi:hypothetical protein